MKVLVRFYAMNNLGDDLFIKVLCNRYPKNKFTIVSPMNNYSFKSIPNLKIVKNKLLLFIDKLLKKIYYKYSFIEMNLKKKNDILVFIGGSVFIQRENAKNYQKSCKIYEKNYIPYYVLGCNVGPFYSNDYLKVVKNNVIKNANSVSFRESYSYELCGRMKNTNFYPDIVLGMDLGVDELEEKKVVISIIDVERKFGSKIGNLYNEKIVELIDYFTNMGYSVTLMSFCKAEGDEKAIKKIKKICNKKINLYFYRGNIEEALNEIKTSKIVVGSRFHANVLGLLFNKTIIPFSYSSKTNNMLNDLGFKGKIIDIKKIADFKIESLTKKDLSYKLNIESIKKEAKNHFKDLDKILNGERDE